MDEGICVRLFAGGTKALIQHDGGYAVAGIEDSLIVVGDTLHANWLAKGPRFVKNLSRGKLVEVALLGNWFTPFGAIRACGGLTETSG